jgi:hypothetical protein
MSARRKEKRGVYRTPAGQRVGEVILLVLLVPIAAAAAAALAVAGAVSVASRIGVEMQGIGAVALAGALVVPVLVFRFRGWPAWTLVLDEEAAVLGPFPRRRVRYEDIAFVAAGTRRGWTGHHDDAETYPLRVETRSGRVATLRLAHADADEALLALHARAPNAGALDAEGHEHLPSSGDAHAIIAARARLAALWAPVVWLSFAGGIGVVALGLWGTVNAARDGEWGAAAGALLIGGAGGWAFGTAWWKALRRARGHRRRVQQAREAQRRDLSKNNAEHRDKR